MYRKQCKNEMQIIFYNYYRNLKEAGYYIDEPEPELYFNE